MVHHYPKGTFIEWGLIFGIPLGAAIGIAIGIFAIGPAIGVALGLAVGLILETRYNPKPRMRTVEERRIRTRNLTLLLVIGIMLVIIFGVAYFFFP